MHKYIYFILVTGLLIVFQTTTYAQPRPRQTTKKPVVKTPPAPTPKPDLLIRRDGTQQEVRVIEITDKEIVYKRFNNLDGPVFRSQKADFSSLKYGSNGEIEQFATAAQPAPTQHAPVQPAPVQPTSTQPASAPTPAPVYKTPSSFSSKKTRFGLWAGGQSAIIAFDGSTEGSKSILGFRGGLLFDRAIGNAGSFRTHALYSSKGTSSTSSNLTLNLNYLEVPFDFLYKIQTPGVQFLVGGGGYFGTLLNANLNSVDAAKLFSTTDAGVRVSGWVDLPSGLTLNVFYNLGLLDINSGINTRETWKNRTLGFGIGYFLLKY
ncbi:hypothetical protein GCM10028807_36830 [Spirosoma daeguense]